MSAEQDLLYSLLDTQWTYPWEPEAPESDSYFARIEADWDEEATAETLAAGWAVLSQQIEHQWGQATDAGVSVLVHSLIQQFQARMPEDLLVQLATAATQLAKSGQPLVDQLVNCVQTVLVDWQVDDLAVLARPLAFSLRDGRQEILELQLRSLSQTDWSDLSALDQARLSLTIASIALKQAETLEFD